jgi:hypothetical protein
MFLAALYMLKLSFEEEDEDDHSPSETSIQISLSLSLSLEIKIVCKQNNVYLRRRQNGSSHEHLDLYDLRYGHVILVVLESTEYVFFGKVQYVSLFSVNNIIHIKLQKHR